MPRRGESIFKRKDGRWEARFIHHYENGKAKYNYVYGATYSEAKAKRFDRMKSDQPLTLTQMNSLNDLTNKWLMARKTYVKESTFARYRKIIEKYILPNMHTEQTESVSNDDFRKLYERLRKTLSYKTTADIMCVLKNIWKFGQDNGYTCCEWSFQKEKSKKVRSVHIIPYETRTNLERILINGDSLVEDGILFALFTGVRIGELCGLRWGDFDFENGFVEIKRTVERVCIADEVTGKQTKVIISEPKTENSSRVIPLPSFLAKRLANRKLNNERYFLTGKTTFTEPHTFYMRYKTFLRKNNLGDYTFHELRHTFATRCVESGFDIKSLSEILGHSNVNTTMNFYVHPTLQMKKQQMEMLCPITE